MASIDAIRQILPFRSRDGHDCRNRENAPAKHADDSASRRVARLYCYASRSTHRHNPQPIMPKVVGILAAPGATRIALQTDVLAWLRSAAVQSKRYGSICTGAFILAATGLLKGRRLTTHWAAADALAEAYPSLAVEADALYVRDGKLRTGAGVTAGLDLALALVEEDLGRDIARRVAAQLVMFFKRPGGQLQFSRSGEARPAGRSVLQEVQRWIAGHPAFEHSVAELAKHAGMSPRHFARLFRAEVGMTPAAWVETTRISAARQLLENGHDTPKQVAAKCGFANVDTLRRAFVRHVGITPAEYRKRQTVVQE